jgi:hypothetical protein
MYLEFKHVKWFVTGFMTDYYESNGQKPADYTVFTQDTVQKVWEYLSEKRRGIDVTFHDQQAAAAIQAELLFAGFALNRRKCNAVG